MSPYYITFDGFNYCIRDRNTEETFAVFESEEAANEYLFNLNLNDY